MIVGEARGLCRAGRCTVELPGGKPSCQPHRPLSLCSLTHAADFPCNRSLLSRALLPSQYFHNWTGNRVTCRDWFQLTLKEGLTVYRDQVRSGAGGPAGLLAGARAALVAGRAVPASVSDVEYAVEHSVPLPPRPAPARPTPQEFSADMNSRPVKRIEDVLRLRAAQLPEVGYAVGVTERAGCALHFCWS